ncbi:MAG TPA: cyclase family protein [Solirubrobacteraceae bacterium]|nr:cyclase family protein [Solirubrobacteraceae bacterium]
MTMPLEFLGTGGRRIVDLSMPVNPEMMTFPRVPPPMLLVNETHEEFAERIGAAAHGVDKLTAHYMVIQDDHVGTHCDSRKHIVPDAGGPETIPLDFCLADGVLLDFTAAEKGHGITAAEVEAELDRIGYAVKPRDIVLIHTGAGAYNTEERYKTDHPGMTAGATRWLIERGVRMMGIDAITFDPPVWAMFEREQFWEAHRVMWDEEYWHLENLMNLELIGRPHGFTLCVLPVKWVGTTGAPVRAIAIVEE